MLLTLSQLKKSYTSFKKRLLVVHKMLQRPLTLTEKILYAHLDENRIHAAKRGTTYEEFVCDRVAMQDATAQMAILQFISSGIECVQCPTSVHCDHLILAENGAVSDLATSIEENGEVYTFLKTAAAKYGIDFWQPGAGIIHQVILENYAFPGGLLIGTDSHTPNAGGLCMLAVGVGGSEAVDVMAGLKWELKMPTIIGVKLTGKLRGWASPKDIILKVADVLTVKGGTGSIIEYIGTGARSISCTGKATICNMGAEVGATASIFPYDDAMKRYLVATQRGIVAELADQICSFLKPDPYVEQFPEDFYDQVIHIDLSTLEPYVNGPYSPDRAWSISTLKQAVLSNQYPEEIKVALIGSCTNSSYEDIQKAACIASQAIQHGIVAKCPLTITPGSEQIRATIERDGLLSVLEQIGATVLANACGPCIGQWKRHDISDGEKNSILTSYNRNFSRRNDANPGTHSFVASPEIVVAMALSGKMTFNPLIDPLVAKDGKEFFLTPPVGNDLPKSGFNFSSFGLFQSEKGLKEASVSISPTSERLQKLEPFTSWEQKEFANLRVLVKVQGKCTTDHISPAGKWLKFRGHLDNISNNMFSGAMNSYRDLIGRGVNLMTNMEQDFSDIARYYKAHGIGWVAIGDENYGEGSSREHAAMEPRYLGCVSVIAKSFARIHETNLKKQGVLALQFMNTRDYDKIQEEDVLEFIDIKDLKPGKAVHLKLNHRDGHSEVIALQHTYTDKQIRWFWSGSSLQAQASAYAS